MGFWDAFQLHPNQSVPQTGGVTGSKAIDPDMLQQIMANGGVSMSGGIGGSSTPAMPPNYQPDQKQPAPKSPSDDSQAAPMAQTAPTVQIPGSVTKMVGGPSQVQGPSYDQLYTSLSQLGQRGGFLGSLIRPILGTGVNDQTSRLAQQWARVVNPATGQVHMIPHSDVQMAIQAGGKVIG